MKVLDTADVRSYAASLKEEASELSDYLLELFSGKPVGYKKVTSMLEQRLFKKIGENEREATYVKDNWKIIVGDDVSVIHCNNGASKGDTFTYEGAKEFIELLC
jgi:fumarylacetoacetate (FAA) hydrolase family protein